MHRKLPGTHCWLALSLGGAIAGVGAALRISLGTVVENRAPYAATANAGAPAIGRQLVDGDAEEVAVVDDTVEDEDVVIADVDDGAVLLVEVAVELDDACIDVDGELVELADEAELDELLELDGLG